MKLILAGELADPNERRPGYPPELAAIVRRACARDPGERYQTARDMVGELDALAAQRRWSSSRAAIGDLVRLIQARVASERRAATVRDPGVRA